MRSRILKKNLAVALFFLAAIGLGLYLILRHPGQPVEIKNRGSSSVALSSEEKAGDFSLPKSPISGLGCADALRRPIAVMLSSDAPARPLSGLAQADLVIEMPVVINSITRPMAVYVCGNPTTLGSVRSARDDYISLAQGLDAIYIHWGGSHFALDQLNAGVMNNIDALKNPFDAFYRKSGVVAPFNGFSSISRLFNAVQKLGYRLENKFSGYPHLTQDVSQTKQTKTLEVAYGGEFDVKYNYDPVSNSYLRWRGGKKEIDKNTGEQIAAKNVVVMRTDIKQLEGQYNDVRVTGEGKAAVYRAGEEISATWKKDAKDPTSKLYFYDARGEEIKFVPGQIWIEIVETNQDVIWQ